MMSEQSLGAILFSAQVALGAITALLVVRAAAGRLSAGVSGAFAADVTIPLILLAPFLFAAPRVGPALGTPGWIVVGAPVIVGAIGAALALGLGKEDRLDALPPGAQATWAAAGAVALLLAAAHGLHFTVGQVMLVSALVVLWMNSPPDARQVDDAAPHGGLLFLAFVLSATSGVLGLFAPEDWSPAGAVVGIAVGAVVLSATVRLSGGVWALRVGAWTAVLGLFGGAGVMSASHLLLQMRGLAADQYAGVNLDVTRGFGMVAPEAALLLMLPFVPVARSSLSRGTRAVFGLAIALTAIGLAGWRLAA